MGIYLLTFYTDGTEGGLDLSNSAAQIKQKLSTYFTEIFVFNKKDLKMIMGSEEFCNSFEEELQMNINANHIGYFDFKSFLIDYILKKIPDGSILLYHDANFEKNDQYWQSDWRNIESICSKLLAENQSDVFVQIEQGPQFDDPGIYVKQHVKTYTIDRIFTDSIENNIVKNCYLINAARIILRNSDFSRKFIKDYMELCRDKTLLAKSPNPNPDKDFKWSCGDQDVLNCLVYKYILEGKLNPSFPQFWFWYRVIRFENSPFPWYGRPHRTGIEKVLNHGIIEHMKNKK